MKLFDVLFGRPLASDEAHSAPNQSSGRNSDLRAGWFDHARVRPEAAMTLLIPLGIWGVQHYLLPIFGLILTLLTILYFKLSADH